MNLSMWQLVSLSNRIELSLLLRPDHSVFVSISHWERGLNRWQIISVLLFPSSHLVNEVPMFKETTQNLMKLLLYKGERKLQVVKIPYLNKRQKQDHSTRFPIPYAKFPPLLLTAFAAFKQGQKTGKLLKWWHLEDANPGTNSRYISSQNASGLLLLSRFSHVQLCATPRTTAHQAPLSLGFSRQEHRSGMASGLEGWYFP